MSSPFDPSSAQHRELNARSCSFPIQSQALRLESNGSRYPTAKLLNLTDYSLNLELFEEVGVPRISAQLMWGYL